MEMILVKSLHIFFKKRKGVNRLIILGALYQQLLVPAVVSLRGLFRYSGNPTGILYAVKRDTHPL
jgi:hypothetical protein